MSLYCKYNIMKDALVQFKTSLAIKQEAMKVAGEMGMDLSTLLNLYLHSFVKNKEIHFSLRPRSVVDEVKSRLLAPKFLTEKQIDNYIKSMK